MRTTALDCWRVEVEEFDREVKRVAEAILGTPLSDRAWAQAALTPSWVAWVSVAWLFMRMGPLLLQSPRGRRGSHGSALLRLRPIVGPRPKLLWPSIGQSTLG